MNENSPTPSPLSGEAIVPEGKFYTAFSRTCRNVFRSRAEAKSALPKYTLIREFTDNASAMNYMMFGTYSGPHGEMLRDEQFYSANQFYSTSAFVDTAPVCSCIVAVKKAKESNYPHAHIVINDPVKTQPFVIDVPLVASQMGAGVDHGATAAFVGINACLEILFGPADDTMPLGGLLSLDQQALIVIGKSQIIRRLYKSGHAHPYECEVKKRLNSKTGGKENGKFLKVRLVESDRVPLYLSLTQKMQDKEEKK